MAEDGREDLSHSPHSPSLVPCTPTSFRRRLKIGRRIGAAKGKLKAEFTTTPGRFALVSMAEMLLYSTPTLLAIRLPDSSGDRLKPGWGFLQFVAAVTIPPGVELYGGSLP
jgi:hypothetical protein